MKKTGKVLLAAAIPAAAYIGWRLGAQTTTEPVDTEDGIAELRPVRVRGTNLWTMIRGHHRDNPVIVFVTGGPCGTEIPLCRKYERQLEELFTIVHYDQRGAGKSFEFGKDYSTLSSEVHVADLIALVEYIRDYLHKDKVILVGHSYGTYLGTQAAAAKPEYFRAYVGIGQMADTRMSEIESAGLCIDAAARAGNDQDVKKLKEILEKVRRGETFTPRKYVRKYGFSERKNHHMERDLLLTAFFGKEYNLADLLKFFYSINKYSLPLVMEAIGNPVSARVKELKVPVYFLMGKYDGMTCTGAAEKYYRQLMKEKGEFVVFENSAHTPQVEENEAFTVWMAEHFGKDRT
ncbi:MAG: alpha/beta hydrolase [Lachnospiraceae bacterium]|nr:alpha/beta hydrolase [Lachnospiraceae bacterium]